MAKVELTNVRYIIKRKKIYEVYVEANNYTLEEAIAVVKKERRRLIQESKKDYIVLVYDKIHIKIFVATKEARIRESYKIKKAKAK